MRKDASIVIIKSNNMKRRLLQLFPACLMLFVFYTAEAKIWRVNNNGYSADFASLNAANNDNRVRSGDTVHVEGSATGYGDATNSKRLVILGPGYFLLENAGNSVNSFPANFSYITFAAGSAGSELQGISVTGEFGITANVSNILIKRCKIDYDVNLTYGISDVRIVQNYFTTLSGNLSVIDDNEFGFPTDVVFNNNIVRRPLLLRAGYTFVECNNNVFDVPPRTNAPSLSLNAGVFRNNILTNPSVTVNINGGSIINVTHNISAGPNQFGVANNNIIVSSRAGLFVDQGTSTDGNYQLRPGSPGSLNGSDGTDRGAFGGISPAVRYTLSGLPPVPVIYELTTPSVGTPSGLNITIKARTVK